MLATGLGHWRGWLDRRGFALPSSRHCCALSLLQFLASISKTALAPCWSGSTSTLKEALRLL